MFKKLFAPDPQLLLLQELQEVQSQLQELSTALEPQIINIWSSEYGKNWTNREISAWFTDVMTKEESPLSIPGYSSKVTLDAIKDFSLFLYDLGNFFLSIAETHQHQSSLQQEQQKLKQREKELKKQLHII